MQLDLPCPPARCLAATIKGDESEISAPSRPELILLQIRRGKARTRRLPCSAGSFPRFRWQSQWFFSWGCARAGSILERGLKTSAAVNNEPVVTTAETTRGKGHGQDGATPASHSVRVTAGGTIRRSSDLIQVLARITRSHFKKQWSDGHQFPFLARFVLHNVALPRRSPPRSAGWPNTSAPARYVRGNSGSAR